MLSVTLEKTVGSMKYPTLPKRLPPASNLAPSFWPVSMYLKTFVNISSSTWGPFFVSSRKMNKKKSLFHSQKKKMEKSHFRSAYNKESKSKSKLTLYCCCVKWRTNFAFTSQLSGFSNEFVEYFFMDKCTRSSTKWTFSKINLIIFVKVDRRWTRRKKNNFLTSNTVQHFQNKHHVQFLPPQLHQHRP